MRIRQKRVTRRVSVEAEYGVGGSVSGVFRRDELAGKPAREVLQRVVDAPQEPGAAERTAQVLRDALRTQREIDLELTKNASRRSEGQPIGFDRVLVPREEDGEQDERSLVEETEKIKMRLSESYRGGA